MMNKMWYKISSKWEIAAFWMVLMLIAAVAVMWITGFGADRPQPVMRSQAPVYRSLLSDDALAFVQLPEPSITGNPFALELKVRETKPAQKPWQEQATEKKTADANAKTETVTKTETEPEPQPQPEPEPEPVVAVVEPPSPKPVPEPPKPPEVRIVEFLGMMTTTSGRRAAYIQTMNPANQDQQLRFVAKGAELEGFQIADFSEDALTVIDAEGRKQEILFGQQKEITLK